MQVSDRVQQKTKENDGKDRPILSVEELHLVFHTYAGQVKALNGVNFTVYSGEILGIVGESGCGKSVTALAIAGLLPANAEITEGRITLNGRNLLELSREDRRLTRLTDIAIVFQDPTTYLNPIMPIGKQITEIMQENPKIFFNELVQSRLKEIKELEKRAKLDPKIEIERQKLSAAMSNGKLNKREFRKLAKIRALQYLKLVRIPDPERVFKMHCHELSGGMKQRAMIAIALARKPKVLLADEITTALDVTIQAQILSLLIDLRKEVNASIVLITHDLGVVATVCDRVAVLYAGNVVETATVDELFSNPLHPYTKALLQTIPRPDIDQDALSSIPGSVPDLITPPLGCRFHPRCPYCFEKCKGVRPPLISSAPKHEVACFLYGE